MATPATPKQTKQTKQTTINSFSIISNTNIYLVVLLLSIAIAIAYPTQSISTATKYQSSNHKMDGSSGGRNRRSQNGGAVPMMASAEMAYESSPPVAMMSSRSMKKMSSPEMPQRQRQHHTQPKSTPTSTTKDSSSSSSATMDTRMLVYRGNMNIQTDRDSLHTLGEAAKEYVIAAGGYVESASSNVGYKDHRSGKMINANNNIQLRIPSLQFRTTMNYFRHSLAAGEQDNILSESESVNDVTNQYNDASSRAATLQGTHKALLQLLSTSKTTKDILAVRRELRQVVQELESRKVTMKALQSQADFSSISLNLKQRPIENEPIDTTIPWATWKPLESLETALKTLNQLTIWTSDKFIITVVFALPLSIVVFIIKCCCFRKNQKEEELNGMA